MSHPVPETNGHQRRSAHDFDDRSPEQIQRELDATRREMANTIHAIETELSSRQLMTRAVDFLRGGPLRFSQGFAETCASNPIPVALIGVGLVWLARADASGGGLRLTGETGERLREKLDQTKETAREMRERAHELRVRSEERFRHSVGTVQRAWHENPMTVGLVALAAGAFLAAVLPTTRREREVIGPRRDRFIDEAKDSAKSVVETAAAGVESIVSESEVPQADEPLTSDLYPEDVPCR